MQSRMNEDRGLENRSLGDLFAELANETGTLVRQEVGLAKAEVTQKAKQVGKNVGYLLIGGAIAYAAFLAFIASLIMLLAKVIPQWGATLLVGVLIAGLGWLLIGKALSALQQTEITPRHTVDTLKEDATWLKEQIK
jgi:hypothetical protein